MKNLNRFKRTESYTLSEAFSLFISSKRASGIADKTANTYHDHFVAVSKRTNVDKYVDSFNIRDYERLINNCRDDGLSETSIRSYTATLRSFFSWCQGEGYSDFVPKLYVASDTVKATYSDEELIKLLKKPNLKKCTFAEFRSWVIVNLLVNNGCRASTVRAILIKDVDFENSVIVTRHNKNHRVQSMPMSEGLKKTLVEYLSYRKGTSDDYLFVSEDGKPMSESCLRNAIVRYNHSRGVELTSIHAMRHTYAMKCISSGVNAFTLQKLLGHSSLDMTKKYVNMYDPSMAENYEAISPLSSLQRKMTKLKIK